MPRLGKLALPGDDVVWGATLSMTNESTDPDYAVENIQNDDPADVARATSNSTVVTIATAAPVTPVGVSIINTNATSATLANGAGLSQAITIPALTPDGQRVHGWKDLTGLANRTASSFTVTLSRASGNVWLGRIALVVAWQDVNWQYGVSLDVVRPGVTVIKTRLGSTMVHDAGIRVRSVEATPNLEEDAPMWNALEQSAKGQVFPFLLVPFADVNDARWVRLPAGFKERLADPGFTEIPLRLEEVSSGPPNG